MRKPPLVTVVWTDARDVYESEVALAEVGKYGLCEDRETSGRLVFKDDVKVVIAHDLDWADRTCGNLTVIPRGWVKVIQGEKRERRRPQPKPEAPPS